MRVITTPNRLTCEYRDNLRAHLKKLMPNEKVLILEGGMKMDTIKPCRRAKSKPSLLIKRVR